MKAASVPISTKNWLTDKVMSVENSVETKRKTTKTEKGSARLRGSLTGSSSEIMPSYRGKSKKT
jgi:hypothetical protein